LKKPLRQVEKLLEDFKDYFGTLVFGELFWGNWILLPLSHILLATLWFIYGANPKGVGIGLIFTWASPFCEERGPSF